MGLSLTYRGMDFDMATPPSTDELIAEFVKRGNISLNTIKQFPGGQLFPERSAPAQPKAPDWPHRLNIGDTNMMAQLQALGEALTKAPAAARTVGTQTTASGKLSMQLISSRLHGVYNSVGHNLPALQKRVPYNPVFMHPDDAKHLRLSDGDTVTVANQMDRLKGRVELNEHIRPGVIAAAHAFPGGASEDDTEPNFSASALIDDNSNYDALSGLPQMSAVHVTVSKASRP